MLAPESPPPPDAEMGGPELCNMRQHRSPPVQGGSRRTCGNVGAHLSEVALVWHCGARGGVWVHALPLVLT
jgi:hypothetical protein